MPDIPVSLVPENPVFRQILAEKEGVEPSHGLPRLKL